jgi:hypothetical protein
MVVLALIPRTPNTEELLNSLYANAGLAGFGLLLTAIIETLRKQLSLFEALFILHILFFLGTGVSPMGKCLLSILFLWSPSYRGLIHFLPRLQVNMTGRGVASPWAFWYSSSRS